jgi:hypothetical protein
VIAIDRILARTAGERIITSVPVDKIDAACALDCIIASFPAKHIGIGTA